MNMFEKAAAEPFKPHQCMHWSDGRRCRAYAIHNEYFCVRHRIDPIIQIVPSEPFSLPPFLTDRAQIQAALGEVLNRLAAKTIDDKRAGLALYTLQNAISNLSAPARRLPRILTAAPLRRRRRLRSFHWQPTAQSLGAPFVTASPSRVGAGVEEDEITPPQNLTADYDLIKPDPSDPHSDKETPSLQCR